MLDKREFQDTDTLYVLGDVIDRGLKGIQILLDMMARPNVVPILGNHELMAASCLTWILAEITDQSIAGIDEIRIGSWYSDTHLPACSGGGRGGPLKARSSDTDTRSPSTAAVPLGDGWAGFAWTS